MEQCVLKSHEYEIIWYFTGATGEWSGGRDVGVSTEQSPKCHSQW